MASSQMLYETVIGLEVHVELHTKSKIFCQCATSFGALPNTHTCPICLGHPGVLPVLNQQALEYAMKAAMALNCKIGEYTIFDRKNYFYPDSPKAYQISQKDNPVGLNGWIDIEIDGKTKRIGITRVHLEEDAGKLTHDIEENSSYIDFNRVGTPLIEIVSEPDLRSPEEARIYLEKLRAMMLYCEVSDVKMEEGSLRCDANVSIRPYGQKQLGTRTELKNMNSFRSVQKGLEYEVWRQSEVLNEGKKVLQETRRFDETKGETFTMRSKEEAHDYRYFTDPDLVKMIIYPAWKEKIKKSIPELPHLRQEKYMARYGLSKADAEIITSSKSLSDFFEDTIQYTNDVKTMANWMIGDLLGYLNANHMEITDMKLSSKSLGEMIGLIEDGTISSKMAKSIFKEMMETGKSPEIIVKESGLTQISDEQSIKNIVLEVIQKNPQSVADFKSGKEKAIGFLVGQIMKETKGKANPNLVNSILREFLK